MTVYNPGGGLSNGVRFTVTSPAAAARLDYAPSSATPTYRSQNANVSTGEVMGEQVTNPYYSPLASNALYARPSWMPSGLTQWLIFAIILLLIIIVVRKLYFENKYHSTPLKHA